MQNSNLRKIKETVSAVVVTYKRPLGLRRTLESISKQSQLPDEVIVCDDASNDETESIASEWSGKFKNYRYVKNNSNMGMPANLNNGIAQARGDFIVNFHDADYYFENVIEDCLKMFRSHPKAGLVSWHDDYALSVFPDLDEITPGHEFFRKHYLGNSCSKIWGTSMVRRETYEELLPFDSQFGAWADVDMWMRICLKWDIAMILEPSVRLYVEEGQFREWDWHKTVNIQNMFFLNICRHFYGVKRKQHLRLQQWVMRKLWFRYMLGRIVHLEWHKILPGFAYYRKFFFTPTIVKEYLRKEHDDLST